MTKIILNGNVIKSKEKLHSLLKEKLNFPDYYGNNLDALWDMLTSWVTLPLTIKWIYFEKSKVYLGEYAETVLELFENAAKELDGFKIVTKQI